MAANPRTQSRNRRKRCVLFFAQDGLCHYCDRLCWLPGAEPLWETALRFGVNPYTPRWKRRLAPVMATLDHIIPRSRGGLNTWENFVMACQQCNVRRGSMPYAAFVDYINGEILAGRYPDDYIRLAA